MANSMYNSALLEKASELLMFVAGEVDTVDLSGFQVLSNARAERKGKNARKYWQDSAEVVDLASGGIQTVGSINSHTMAVGDVLGEFGFRGVFYITSKLQLVRTKPEEPQVKFTTVADIVAAAKVKAAKASK